jgi:uncharacterized protein YecT (DUF1311 family)
MSDVQSLFFRGLALMVMAVPAAASAADFAQCNRGGSQLELNACAIDELTAADKKLNEIYKALLNKEKKNAAFVQKLRAAQRAWLAFRDAELDAMFACNDSDQRQCWGSMLPMRFAYYKAKLTSERAARLQQLLDHGQPADD